MNENKEIRKSEKEPLIHSVYDTVEMLVMAVITVFLIFMCFVRPCRVDGDSMKNTLEGGQMLLISSLFYTPKTGDIVVFHQTSETDLRFNEPIVKRIIATGGQYVMINAEAGKLYVSNDDVFTEDEVVSEEYAYFDNGKFEDYYKISGKIYEVPDGSVFVLGDNRNNSADSRSPIIGLVDERRILGKVILRITPFDKFGTV